MPTINGRDAGADRGEDICVLLSMGECGDFEFDPAPLAIELEVPDL